MKDKTTISEPKISNGDEICIVNQKIRNRFKEIILEALRKQHEVLIKRKKDLETWQDEEKKEFLILFGRNEDSAKNWMLHGVNKMLILNERLTEKDFEYVEECIFASVNDVVDKNNKIHVGPKFFNAPLMGTDSRVATLCHEFSHVSEIMNTKDIASPDKKLNSSQYAIELVRKQNRDVMNNAYNIERYFE